MKRHWFGLVLIVLSLAGMWMAYPYLPDQLPIHWNYKGIADNFTRKSLGIFIMPLIMLVMYLFMIILPKIDPKKNNYQRFQGTYFQIMNGILLFIFLFQAVSILSALEIVNPKYVIPEIVGLLFIFIGNLSPKFKPNYFLGIRTPWTLANEEVWKKTHRFGGKIFVISGLLMLLVPILPGVIQAYYTLGVLVVCLALIVLSSYYFFIKI